MQPPPHRELGFEVPPTIGPHRAPHAAARSPRAHHSADGCRDLLTYRTTERNRHGIADLTGDLRLRADE